ncbi:MAG: hypothetical protein LBI48_07485 [Burkholderiaceae bacterium]|jgi:hypothetical protein|nr:hypothetical protein [Burkholderiaceae bacterium]
MKAKTVSHLVLGVILAAGAVTGQAQTAVSLSIGQPGFYGAIDIGGGAPPPALVYQQPVAIQPVAVGMAPLYLYVPPDQYANWGTYCGYYNACNRSVYFVDSGWYQRVYVPHYRSHRSMYDRRRANFARYTYRPPARMDRSPARVEHRSAPPAPRVNSPRPPVRMESRSAPPPRPVNTHPRGKDEHGRR